MIYQGNGARKCWNHGAHNTPGLGWGTWDTWGPKFRKTLSSGRI